MAGNMTSLTKRLLIWNLYVFSLTFIDRYKITNIYDCLLINTLLILLNYVSFLIYFIVFYNLYLLETFNSICWRIIRKNLVQKFLLSNVLFEKGFCIVQSIQDIFLICIKIKKALLFIWVLKIMSHPRYWVFYSVNIYIYIYIYIGP